MLPQTYIFIVKGSVMIAGVLLIIFGALILQKNQKSNFEFSLSFFNKLSTKLKGGQPGLLMILLGVVLMLSVLLIPMKAEWLVPVEEKNPPPPKEYIFRPAEDVFGEKSK